MRLKISDKENILKGRAIGFEIGFAQGFEQGFKEGFKIGFERGIIKSERKGRLERTLEIAKSLITAGMNIANVSLHTGLSVDEINALAK